METKKLLRTSIFPLGFVLVFAIFIGIGYLLKEEPSSESKNEPVDLIAEEASKPVDIVETTKQPDNQDGNSANNGKTKIAEPTTSSSSLEAPDTDTAPDAPAAEKVAPQLSISDVENYVVNNTNLFNLTPGYTWRSRRLGYIDYISSQKYYDSIGLYCSDPVTRCFVAIIENDGTGKPKYSGLSYEFLAPADVTSFIWGKPNFTIGFTSGEYENLQLVDGKIIHVEPRG